MKLATLLEQNSISLEPLKLKKLEEYSKILLEWNKIHNLTGSKSHDEVYLNILDSIYPTTFLDEPDSILDIGTGAGFPGLILAVEWESSRVTLCEPRAKRVSFLKFIAGELELENIRVERKRVEDLNGAKFSLVTSRAVASSQKLIELSERLTTKESRYLLFKGEKTKQEGENLSDFEHKIIKRDFREYLYLYRLGE